MSEEKDTPNVMEAYFVEHGMPEMAARILYVAMKLFATKGYSATSVREIVQEANVTNPMLYYYFENKEGVFKRLIELLFEGMEEGISLLVDRDDLSFREKLRGVMDLHLDGVLEAPEALSFVYSVLFGPSDGRPDFDPMAHRQKTFLGMAGMFSSAIEAGELVPNNAYDPMFLTTQFIGMINQHLMMSLKVMEAAGDPDASLLLPPGVEREDLGEWMVGNEARERLLQFYFDGAGTLRSDAHE